MLCPMKISEISTTVFVAEPNNQENVCGSYCSGFRSTNEVLKLWFIEWKNSFGSGGKWEQD